MSLFPSQNRLLDLGPCDRERCSTCQETTAYHLLVHYTMRGYERVVAGVTSKRYLLLCQGCRQGWELDTLAVESELGRNPIPLRHRAGSWVLFALALSAACATRFITHL